MKLCRNIICHVKLCCEGLIFFKMAAVAMETTKMLKIEKHKKDHSRLLAEHLMERDKPKKSESVGQTLPQLPWKKKGGFKKKMDSFHQTSLSFVGISTGVCGSFWGVETNSKWRPLTW
jgi:hypothetical protein